MFDTSLSQRSSIKHEYSLLLGAIIQRSKGILLTDHLFDHAFKMIEKYPFLREVSTPVYQDTTGIVPYNFFAICALYHQDFPSVTDKFNGLHKPFRPMIDVLLSEDITRARMLLKHGFEIVKDCGFCIYCKHDERFNYGELDLIDVLIEHNKHESIRFIQDVISKEILLKRDEMACYGKYKYCDIFKIL